MRWMFPLACLFAIGCDKPVESTEATSQPDAPRPAPMSMSEEPPPADSTEIAVSEGLWSRVEYSRELAFQGLHDKSLIPFAICDLADQDQIRRYRGTDQRVVLGKAREEMSEMAQSLYTITYPGVLDREGERQTVIFIEACEKEPGDCNRFIQRYTQDEDGGNLKPVGDLTYVGECLSAFRVAASQPWAGEHDHDHDHD